MLDPLGSTSWHHRHLASFQTLNELLLAEAVERPIVLIVGPGGVSQLAAPFLNDSADGDASRFRRLLGDLARYSDHLLRRIPRMPLASLEPMELTRSLTMPHELVVADLSQRVLAAIARDLPGTTCHCVDISFQPLPLTADVVVAFNVICRLEEQAARGMAGVAAAVRPGGWLLMDDRSAEAHLSNHPGFVHVAPKTYRRAAEAGGNPSDSSQC